MTPDYYVIGRRIKQCRLDRKMTQEELADEISISVAFLSRVERGNAHLNLRRLTQIAEVLKVSPGYLLTVCRLNISVVITCPELTSLFKT